MNWHDTLRTIYSKLEDNGYATIANEIHEGQLRGGTGGEIFDIVISKLIFIKNNHQEVYLVIKPEIDSLIDFAVSIGYIRKKDE